MIERILLAPRGPGLHEFTPEVERAVARAGLREGLCTLFVQHPVVEGRLGLGTWQGIYLWEHRRAGGPRSVLVHLGS